MLPPTLTQVALSIAFSTILVKLIRNSAFNIPQMTFIPQYAMPNPFSSDHTNPLISYVAENRAPPQRSENRRGGAVFLLCLFADSTEVLFNQSRQSSFFCGKRGICLNKVFRAAAQALIEAEDIVGSD